MTRSPARLTTDASGRAVLDRVLRPGRLVGIDLARTLALVGMIATHLLDPRTVDGTLTATQSLAGGRASALFAVLAGLSMALMSGGRDPVRGRLRTAVIGGLAARAVLIAVIGLALGGLDSGLAVILTYYGVVFCLALPFLALRAPALAAIAVGWVVAAPICSHLLRPRLPDRLEGSPELGDLATPGRLLADLLFTGTYPAFPWLAYLLVGLALGRIDLSGWRTPARLVVGGGLLAVIATLVSMLCTSDPAVRRALFPYQVLTHDQALRILEDSLHGSTPTGAAWQWLLVVSPHSATPFDLAQTIGSALVAIGLCLLLVDRLPRPGKVLAALVAGAGAMPLTLYTLHVLMRAPEAWQEDGSGVFGVHIALLLGIGAVFAAMGWRGPLEWVVGWPGQRLRRAQSAT